MVHLLALPGAPAYGGSLQQVLDRALLDAQALLEGGVDGIMIENYGDIPFYGDAVPAITVSALTRAVTEVRRAVDLPLGVNVLRNDAHSALAIAACTDAQLIRVNVHSGAMLTDQGWLTGRANETMRARAALDANVAVFADVLVKHAVPPAGLTLDAAARDTWERGAADALIVSGVATGAATDITDARVVKEALPEAEVWIGSGVTADNVAQLLQVADGAIVGSAFQDGQRAGRRVVVDQVRRLVEAARHARP